MLDPQCLVQIYANDTDTDPCIGTGYFIGNGLILTARHVVLFPNRAPEPKLKLVFPERESDGSLKMDGVNPVYDFDKAIAFTDDDIPFKDNEEFDLAVIRCPPISFKLPPTRLATINPSNTDKWETKGFPRAAKTSTQRHALRFPVTLNETIEHIFALHTTVELKNTLLINNVEIKNGWNGLSGAPVFAGNQLVAVMTDEHNGVEGYFYATSIPYCLLKNERFREAIKQHIDEAIVQSQKNLHDKVKKEIAKILKKWSISSKELAEEWEQPETVDCIVNYLVEQNTVKQAIIKLKKVLEARKDSISETKQWNDCVKAAETICGWLLIKSVNPTWWYEHEQKINQAVAHRLTLDEPAYIEVIISRSFLKCPQYKIDSITGKARPTRWNEDDDKSSSAPPRMIDSSDKAVKEAWLLAIYKDLHGENTAFIPIANKDYTTEILESIKSRAKTLYEDRDRLIYYIVPVDYFKQLELSKWVTECQEYLAGYLQFICCDKNEQPEQVQSTESQTELIEHLALLLQKKKVAG